METEEELERRVERLLGKELAQMLRAATEALERLAPATFEAIGARALHRNAIDMDTLMVHVAAAAALPEAMARLGMISAMRRAQAQRYEESDWAGGTDTPASTGTANTPVRPAAPAPAVKEGMWGR